MAVVLLRNVRLLQACHSKLPVASISHLRCFYTVTNGERTNYGQSDGSSIDLKRNFRQRRLWRSGARDRLHWCVRKLSSEKGGKHDPEKSSMPPKNPPLKALKTRILSLTPHENIYTVPNVLTFSRLLAAPLIGYLVVHEQHAWAVGLFAYAGITDLVDGWIARRWKLQTVVGTVIDPMADKTLMTVLTGCLAWQGGMPVWLASIILSRDILLGIAAIYYRYISLPPPKTFSRYWDFSLPSAEVHPTGISKVNTALQLGLIGWTVGMPLMTEVFAEWGSWGLGGMQYLVATTTVWSGASYLYSKDAVKILTAEEREQRTKGNN